MNQIRFEDGAVLGTPGSVQEGIGNPPKYRVDVGDPKGFSPFRIAPIRHDVHRHPLMEFPRLARLARELMPTRQCRFIRPGATQETEFTHSSKPHDRTSIDEVLERIEEPGSWIALYDIQTDPEYRALIEEVLGDIRPLVEREQPGMFHFAGYFFISAPPSVTPFHIDTENNCWLQIRGRKRMTIFDRSDRELVPAQAVEEFIIHRSLTNVHLDPALRGRGRNFDVGPGQGVYFPTPSPHMTEATTDWVRPGDRLSISLALVFYTSLTHRHALAHEWNRVLRRVGIQPRFPGVSPLSDAVKKPFGAATRAVRQLMHR